MVRSWEIKEITSAMGSSQNWVASTLVNHSPHTACQNKGLSQGQWVLLAKIEAWALGNCELFFGTGLAWLPTAGLGWLLAHDLGQELSLPTLSPVRHDLTLLSLTRPSTLHLPMHKSAHVEWIERQLHMWERRSCPWLNTYFTSIKVA